MSFGQKILYFFRVSIPEFFINLKDKFFSLSIMFRLAIFIGIFVVLPFTVYKTYLAYQNQVQTHQTSSDKIKITNKEINNFANKEASGYDNNNHSAKTVKKYLRTILMLDTDDEVKNLFDRSAEYHGRYNVIINHAAELDGDDFKNYLNDVADELQKGEQYHAQKIDHNFSTTTRYDVASQNDLSNGVMFILWNSNDQNAQEQAKKIDNYILKSHVKTYVYDQASEQGKQMFSSQLTTYVNEGNKMRDGFNSKVLLNGEFVAYAFNNGLPVFISNSLDNLPNKLPTESIANSTIKNKLKEFE